LQLDGNSVSRVSGIAPLTALTVLHISRQRLPRGTFLTFDHETLRALHSNLRVLHASYCAMREVACLSVLSNLQYLDLSFNNLSDTEDCLALAAGIPGLEELNLRGNEVCATPKFSDHVRAY
jgi:Leucine-rich repeat (LRR) protein